MKTWQRISEKLPVAPGLYWFAFPGRKTRLVRVIDNFEMPVYFQIENGIAFKVNAANKNILWIPAKPPPIVIIGDEAQNDEVDWSDCTYAGKATRGQE